MYLFISILVCLFQTYMLADEKGNRIVPDYGFIAFLYSTRNESYRCTGAIVAESWILNYCEYGDYKYDRVRVGTEYAVQRGVPNVYALAERIAHPNHERLSFPQINDEYDLDSLFAAKNPLFLDRTVEPMTLIGAVWPVVLSRETKLPGRAYAHFFPKADAYKPTEEMKPRHRELSIVNNTYCNDYFKVYNLQLDDKLTQFCVNSSLVSFDDCCANHAIMEVDNKLIGIMAWSTACWSPPEPWVFTNLGFYYEWVTNITADDPIFRSKKIQTPSEWDQRRHLYDKNCL